MKYPIADIRTVRSLMVIDDNDAFVGSLERDLVEWDFSVSRAATFAQGARRLQAAAPSYVVSEIRVAGQLLSECLATVLAQVPVGRIIVATAYPSIATAVHFTRKGVAGYFSKPLSTQILVETLTGSCYPSLGEGANGLCDRLHWPTLDRTIWEYLSQVHLSAGSISEAARRLGLDRRSLRRMLAKYPPAR